MIFPSLPTSLHNSMYFLFSHPPPSLSPPFIDPPVIDLNILPPCPLFVLQSQPLFELRCSNNVVHLHTCADSCAALVNLLQYLVSQGDLHPPPRHTSPTEIAGQKLPVRPAYSLEN